MTAMAHLDKPIVPQFPNRTGDGWRRVDLGELIDLTLSNVAKKRKADENVVRLCNCTDVYYNSFIHADMDFMTATATERRDRTVFTICRRCCHHKRL